MWGVYNGENKENKYFLLKKEADNSSRPLQMDKSLLVNDIIDGDSIQRKYRQFNDGECSTVHV